MSLIKNKETITIKDSEFTIKDCYIKNNIINIELCNKKTRKIKAIIVDTFADKKQPPSLPLFYVVCNDIKTLVIKYISKLGIK